MIKHSPNKTISRRNDFFTSNLSKQFYVFTDASSTGIGGVLTQKNKGEYNIANLDQNVQYNTTKKYISEQEIFSVVHFVKNGDTY